MVRVESLHVYPVKGCAGIALEQATLLVTGLHYDREWMIVDRFGQMITQREHPMLARIRTHLDGRALTLSLYGAGSISTPLHEPWARNKPHRDVQVWSFRTQALDCGPEAASWLSDVLGFSASMVRFNPGIQRPCSKVAGREPRLASRTLFSDGHPVLLVNQASVHSLSEQMGCDVPTNRMRANIVVSGLQAFEEDVLDRIEAPSDGPAQGAHLLTVKPCVRCSVPGIDQDSGMASPIDPLPHLLRDRFDVHWQGATFGMNMAVEQEGELRVGTTLQASFLL